MYPSRILNRLILTVFMFMLVSPHHVAGAEDLLEQIIDAWEARTMSAPCVIAAWEESSRGPGDERASGLLVRLTLGVSGETKIEVMNREAPDVWLSVASFDGSRNYSYTKELNAEDWPRGIVGSSDGSDEINNIQLRPWLLQFKPFAAPIPALLEKNLKLISEEIRERGERCAVVESRSDHSPIIERYWVAYEKDFSVIKFTETHNDITTVEMNVTVARQSDHWVPTKWDAAFSNGKYSFSANLVSVEVRADIPNSEFKIEFPGGTLAFDRDASVRALIREDGTKRIITDEESRRGFTHEELKSSDSGELSSLEEKNENLFRWILGAVVFGGLASLLAIVFFFQKRD